MAHAKTTKDKTNKELLTVEQYAATRPGWRDKIGCNPSYIYKLIGEYRNGKKTLDQLGFKPIEDGKSWLIELL